MESFLCTKKRELNEKKSKESKEEEKKSKEKRTKLAYCIDLSTMDEKADTLESRVMREGARFQDMIKTKP